MVFNDADGIYTYAYEAEKNPDCLACSQKARNIEMEAGAKLQDFIDKLINDHTLQMKKPGVTTSVNGKNKTLYMPNVASIEEATRPNLKKTLKELGLDHGSELVVADVTSPMPLVFRLVIKLQE